MRVQLPSAPACEAMQPRLSNEGYEAADVIGTMAVGGGQNSTSHHFERQGHDSLVGKNVRTLRRLRRPQGDIIVTKKKWKKARRAAGKVVDYMALLGDTIDNIPRKRNRRKGAAELIRYGSVERASITRESQQTLREALQQRASSDDVKAARPNLHGRTGRNKSERAGIAATDTAAWGLYRNSVSVRCCANLAQKQRASLAEKRNAC